MCATWRAIAREAVRRGRESFSARDAERPFPSCAPTRPQHGFSGVIVAPLSDREKASRRDIELTISGKSYVLLPLDLSAVQREALRRPPVANLAHESFRIQTALDIVFSAAG